MDNVKFFNRLRNGTNLLFRKTVAFVFVSSKIRKVLKNMLQLSSSSEILLAFFQEVILFLKEKWKLILDVYCLFQLHLKRETPLLLKLG